MYDIGPWELNAQLPKGTFWKEDGSPDEPKIAKYLSWVAGRYEIPFDICDYEKTRHIPHFIGMERLGTAQELRGLCPTGYRFSRPKIGTPWQESTRANPYTWKNRDGTSNLTNVRSYLEYIATEYDFPKSTAHKDVLNIPGFWTMYQRSGLSFSELGRIYNEVKIEQNKFT